MLYYTARLEGLHGVESRQDLPALGALARRPANDMVSAPGFAQPPSTSDQGTLQACHDRGTLQAVSLTYPCRCCIIISCTPMDLTT